MKQAFIACALLWSTFALPSGAQEVVLSQIATGLEKPVAVTNANDARLFIATQEGRIFVHDGQLRPDPFLDLSSRVLCCGEQGLLGIAFHPRYQENGFFFVSHVNLAGDTVLERYHGGAHENVADPNSRMVLLTIPHRLSNQHYSGHLAFGPDGYLYMSTGDGGGDDYVNARSLDSLLGKMLRLDVDHERPYAIPTGNPFVDVLNARPEIWAYGFRNPWRFSFDRLTGDLWIGDVGQDLREEVNLQPAGSSGGQNYGWYGMEGTYCHEDSGICEAPVEVTPPVLEYAHDDGGCAVTGGYRYRGTASPELYGMYFYADFCTGVVLSALPSEDGSWSAETVYAGPQMISSFGEGADGELYVVDYLGSVLALKEFIRDAHVTPRPRRLGVFRTGLPSRK